MLQALVFNDLLKLSNIHNCSQFNFSLNWFFMTTLLAWEQKKYALIYVHQLGLLDKQMKKAEETLSDTYVCSPHVFLLKQC